MSHTPTDTDVNVMVSARERGRVRRLALLAVLLLPQLERVVLVLGVGPLPRAQERLAALEPRESPPRAAR